MTDEDFIVGLMRENYEAVGFLPCTTVKHQYLANGRYIVQHDRNGKRVGYLLHGHLSPGGVLTVAQHCIEYNKRLRGFGDEAFATLWERASHAGCKQIKVRCATDLPSNSFWKACGFEVTRVVAPHNQRQRAINIMLLDLWPTLW